MAKRDLRRNRKYSNQAMGKIFSTIRSNEIMNESINKAKPPISIKKGIRQTVLDIYHEKGMTEAFNFFKEYNSKFDKPPYTPEIFKKWIMEEYEKTRGQETYVGDDR